jgi:hypothetical protein
MQNGAGERTEKLDMERVFVCGKPGFYMNVVGYKESEELYKIAEKLVLYERSGI